MVFSNFNFIKPSKEEILSVRKLAKCNPDDLDARELWILENQFGFSDDDFDEEVVE